LYAYTHIQISLYFRIFLSRREPYHTSNRFLWKRVSELRLAWDFKCHRASSLFVHKKIFCSERLLVESIINRLLLASFLKNSKSSSRKCTIHTFTIIVRHSPEHFITYYLNLTVCFINLFGCVALLLAYQLRAYRVVLTKRAVIAFSKAFIPSCE